MNFAVIKNNIVTNIIVAETKEIAETITGLTCIEYEEGNPVSMNWTYADGVFTAPAVEETPAE